MDKKDLVLIVDDVNDNIQVIANFIQKENVRIAAAMTGKEALNSIEHDNPDVVLLDLGLPDMDGVDILKIIREKHPHIQVVIVSATNDPEVIVRCMKIGALDYLVKPIEKMRTLTAVRNALKHHRLNRENRNFKQHIIEKKLSRPEAFSDIVTESELMKDVFCYVEMIAENPFPILITGETGVGKELIAQAIHKLSRRQGDFIPVNLAGLDDNMVSSTLFGHLKGAFTGADSNKEGILKKAEEGTVFLDEIGDTSAINQIKLLRVLENQEFMPVGSNVPQRTSTRMVMATNKNLKQLVEQNEFRSDIYYRMSQFHVRIPPLRERPEDIRPLFEHFFKATQEQLNKSNIQFEEDVPTFLKKHSFPGNVRELRNIVSAAVATCGDGPLTVELMTKVIPPKISSSPSSENSFIDKIKSLECLPSLQEANQVLIQEALDRCGNNQGEAAQILGISRTALCKRLSRDKQ